MHPTTANEFLEVALQGFLARVFSTKDAEEPDRFDPLFKKYKKFVNDPDPYWVQEKALHLLADQNAVEFELRSSKASRDPDKVVDFILSKTRARLVELADHYKLDRPKGKMNVPMNQPKLPG